MTLHVSQGKLAVGDAKKLVTQVNHVKTFMDKLYSLFSQSPKAPRELEDSAIQVHSKLCNRPGSIHLQRLTSRMEKLSCPVKILKGVR